MTRVSSFGYTQTMIADLLRNQSKLFDDQQQVNTGKKASDYKGYAGNTATLLGAKTVQTRIDQYTSAGQQVKGILSIYDNSVGVLDTVAADLKQTLTEALANNETYGFNETLEQALNSSVTALNTQVSGNYIFGGSRIDAAPVTAQTLSDLVPMATAADAFQNNSQKAVAQIDDGTGMQYGILASDVAGPLMSVLKAFADFNAGPNGPIDGKLTATQTAFVQTQLANLDSARQTILNTQVENGVRQQRLDNVLKQHESTANVVTGFISDIEDVDMAKAVTNLNNDQISLQASYQIMAQLSQLSLLNFLN
jgi:flagellar hook-associated protein 3 FlgL